MTGAQDLQLIVSGPTEMLSGFLNFKAEVTGTIERILVKNEEPVEFGQPLFLVRPE